MATTPRLSHFAPVLGAAGYFLGDILLLSAEPDKERFSILRRADVEDTVGAMLPFSRFRLAAGVVCGILATPFTATLAFQRRNLLRAAEAPRWVSEGTFLAYATAIALSPVIHGAFYPWARLYQNAQQEAEQPGNEVATEKAVARAKHFGNRLEALYYPFFLALGVGSLLESAAVLTGRSRFPRWSAPLVTPALPMVAATALTANGTGRHPAVRALQGAGFSLGEAIAFAAGALLLLPDPARN